MTDCSDPLSLSLTGLVLSVRQSGRTLVVQPSVLLSLEAIDWRTVRWFSQRRPKRAPTGADSCSAAEEMKSKPILETDSS
ncbi:hypothetical protein [Natrinema sp. HArc-T2]|uniref:hypothetical protein n=1 Tax=Natrinema sp. HArc-T2 TaxID=3242701 RepID=UPI00359D4C24